MKDIDLFFEGQSEQAKLMYTIGLLWSKINARLDSVLSRYKLNIAKFNILMIIKHVGKDDGIQQNEISKRLLVTASNIAKLLAKMEKEGLITRNIKNEDKRAKLIKVTDYASKLLDDVWDIYTKEVENITSVLSKEEINYLTKALFNWLFN